MEIPSFLQSEIRKGNVVLFLGAGASLGSINRCNSSPPLGGQLARLLADEAAIEFDSDQDDLSIVASNSRRRLGDHRYFQFLKSYYQHCKPSVALTALAHYPWFRIYTTNIDDAIEAAYRASPYELDVLLSDSPVADRAGNGSIVQLVKLNGSIDRLENGLIFTPEEYRSHLGVYGNWYEKAALDFLEHPFLFVGTQLNEPVFSHNIDRLMRAKGSRGGTSYIVNPKFSENKRLKFKDENIEPLEGTVDLLAGALGDVLGSHISVGEMLREQNPNVQQLILALPANELLQIAGELDDLEIVSLSGLAARVPPAPKGARQFYFGSDPTWRDVMDGVPAKTEAVTRLLAAIERGDTRILVHGPAGCGKSTALMMAAYETARLHPECFVVWVRRASDFPIAAIEKLSHAVKNPLYVFIDDYSIGASALVKGIGRASKLARFIFAERTHLLPRRASGFYVEPQQTISLAQIGDGDIDALLTQLEQFGPWDRLGKLKPSDRRKELSVVAKKQLLVGMREATQGVGFDKIVASEYQKLRGDYARLAYGVIALASMHRLDMPIQVFDSAIRNLAPQSLELPGERLSGLEEVVHQEGKWLRVRHQLLADFTVSRVISRQDALMAVKAILAALSRYQIPLRSGANRSYVRLFAALTNHEFLWRLFRDAQEEVLDMFRDFERAFGADGLFWLQYALFEERLGGAHLPAAVNHIRAALRTFPSSFQIINAYANIHFALAIHARNAEEALALMEQATQSISDQKLDELNEAYTAVALANGRVAVVKKWMPERVPDELRLADQRLREVESKDPNNFRVKEALNHLHLEAARVASPKRSGRGRRRRGISKSESGSATP